MTSNYATTAAGGGGGSPIANDDFRVERTLRCVHLGLDQKAHLRHRARKQGGSYLTRKEIRRKGLDIEIDMWKVLLMFSVIKDGARPPGWA